MQNDYGYTTSINEVKKNYMSVNAVKIVNLVSAVFLLSAVCACTTTQRAPNMVDYSYVPPTTAINVTNTVGLGVGIDEEF